LAELFRANCGFFYRIKDQSCPKIPLYPVELFTFNPADWQMGAKFDIWRLQHRRRPFLRLSSARVFPAWLPACGGLLAFSTTASSEGRLSQI
jgi:hypothetical protein